MDDRMDNLVKQALKIGLLEVEEQRQRVSQFLGMIQRFAEVLVQELDIAEVCRQFAQIIIEESSFENCSILLWDFGRNRLELMGAYGLEEQLEGVYRHRYRQNLSFSYGEGISGQVFSRKSAVFVEDSSTESIPDLKDAVIRPASLASVPLLDYGVLNVSAFHPQKFGPETRRNWEIAGNIIGSFIFGLKCAGRQMQSVQPHPRPVPIEPSFPVVSGPPASEEFPGFPAAAPPIERIVFDATPLGICILDEQGTVVRVNRSCERIQCGGAQDLVRRSPAVLFQDPQIFERLLRKADESGQVEKSDVNLLNACGEVYIADIFIHRLEPEPGMPAGYLLFVEDMSKRKAFSDRLLQSEKLAALGTMAGGVSHDFNNLLMAILGHVQLIMPRVDDEEIKRRLGNIEKAVLDGSNTVRRLQRFTDREREPQMAALSVDVGEAVKDVVELTKPRWKNFMERSGRKIEIVTDLAPNCNAAINISDLREVLTNLVLNAIDAMPNGGVLTFKTRCSGEHTTIDLSDTGIGMTREIADKIFDPFYTTKGVGNSGLGLSVSWSLVGRYGGDIQVKSKPGKGTTFTIRLARAEAPKAQAAVTKSEGTSAYRLLLVEDDPEILNILRDMLRLKGHRVVATADGQKALDLIGKEKFDLVLTDLGMPAVSGWEIAKRVKEASPETPVVMITGWGAQFEEEDLASRGVDLMLAKPLSWDKLLGSIEKML